MAGVLFMNINIRRYLRRNRVVRHRLDPYVYHRYRMQGQASYDKDRNTATFRYIDS